MPLALQLETLILAAGRSTRFAPAHKALSPPAGPGLMALAARSLALVGLTRVTAVTGHRAEETMAEARALGIRPVKNPDYDRGMFSSVQTGLRAVGTDLDGAFILPVDAALARPASLLSLAAAWLQAGPLARGRVLTPAFDGLTGHPPLVGSRLFRTLAAWSGPGGLRGALGSLAATPEARAEFLAGRRPKSAPAADGPVLDFLDLPDEFVLSDADDPQELERLLARPRPASPSPGWRAALTLLALAGPAEAKKVHALTVGLLARRLAEAAGAQDPELALVGGLCHDLDHGRARHDQRVKERLLALGWPELAAVVGAHTELPTAFYSVVGWSGPGAERPHQEFFRDRPAATVEAALAVHLADKYVKGSTVVGLDERFAPSYAAWDDSAEALASVARRRAAAVAVEDWFRRRLGAEPAAVAAASTGRPWESALLGLVDVLRSFGRSAGLDRDPPLARP
ncbi:MAG: NTP transferase domain-containing protein [Deltaproteobacteria bacterium]|jgi:CTP:molybdopterin cytidylyltransferase MocA|nr:NTP transferase domain-containing protein [Deltaproteobacteria bacterium]